MSARCVRPAQLGTITSFSCSIVFARTTTSARAFALGLADCAARRGASLRSARVARGALK